MCSWMRMGQAIKPAVNAGRLEGDQNVVVIESNATDASLVAEPDVDTEAEKSKKASKTGDLFEGTEAA